MSFRAPLRLRRENVPRLRGAVDALFRSLRGLPAGRRIALGNRVSVLFRMTDVVKHYRAPGGMVHAVDGVSLTIEGGEVLGLIGESGCGKSSLARLAMRI